MARHKLRGVRRHKNQSRSIDLEIELQEQRVTQSDCSVDYFEFEVIWLLARRSGYSANHSGRLNHQARRKLPLNETPTKDRSERVRLYFQAISVPQSRCNAYLVWFSNHPFRETEHD